MGKNLNTLKKIMVFDVPAVSVGALTILKEYYKDAVTGILAKMKGSQ